MFPFQSLSREHLISRLFDVVVVGAGPAGSAAAYHLAKRGISVLLADRADFPRDKTCGDAVVAPALVELQQMGLLEEVQQRFSRVTHVGRHIAVFSEVTPLTPINGFSEGYVAPRKDFDALLCGRALSLPSCSWYGGMLIHDLSYDKPAYIRIFGRDEHASSPKGVIEIKTRLLIAADGSRSWIARRVRNFHLSQPSLDTNALTLPLGKSLPHGQAHFTAMRSYWKHIRFTQHTLDFFFAAYDHVHYLWIFPISEEITNVGVIITLDQSRSSKLNFRQLLEDFVQQQTEPGRQAVQLGKWQAAPIATGLRDTALYGPRVLCVGDAAALAEPTFAEGISGALWSGRMAAEVATEALNRGDFSLSALQPYGEAIRNRYQAHYDQAFQN